MPFHNALVPIILINYFIQIFTNKQMNISLNIKQLYWLAPSPQSSTTSFSDYFQFYLAPGYAPTILSQEKND